MLRTAGSDGNQINVVLALALSVGGAVFLDWWSDAYPGSSAGFEPVDYYAMVFALLAATVAISIKAHWIAAAFAITWVLLVVRFAARRMRDTSRRPAHVVEMLVTSAIIPVLSVYWHVRGLMHNRVLFR